MSTSLRPFVYWAQSETNRFIESRLKRCTGVGAKGLHNYEFSIDFYSDIQPDTSSYKIHPSKVDINVSKEKKAWWPRVTSTPQKPIWLKVDFDRWQSEEDLGDDSEVRDVREDYPNVYDQLQKEERGYKKVWSAVEIVRYPYYITQLYKTENKILTWLRYSIWIPLYPLGFLCEGIIVLRSIAYVEETGIYSISLPNSYNVAFHFPTVLRIYLLFFLFPGMYVMMSHMYRVRKAKLGTDKKKIKKSA
ncbi:ptpla domain protein [Holotrichia oblita]|uniref:Ptpla domain protein n=1 Tax=Holotrichia oblita TaxID=644536 RepID=A0ACB9SST1_HOLOL|nr:ptpla domain protein [Holotrichia oblita]